MPRFCLDKIWAPSLRLQDKKVGVLLLHDSEINSGCGRLGYEVSHSQGYFCEFCLFLKKYFLEVHVHVCLLLRNTTALACMLYMVR